jgi:hypothetical protein
MEVHWVSDTLALNWGRYQTLDTDQPAEQTNTSHLETTPEVPAMSKPENALDTNHIYASSILVANLQQCRSLGLRFVGAAPGYEEIRPAARLTFDWMIAKRGAQFTPEQRKLLQEVRGLKKPGREAASTN